MDRQGPRPVTQFPIHFELNSFEDKHYEKFALDPQVRSFFFIQLGLS
jgi:hypothetical protein